MVPARFEAFGSDAAFAFVGFESVEGHAAQPREILGPVALADSSLVFVEAHVQLPVQVVFHRPMAADQLSRPLGVQALEAADEVSPFGADVVADLPDRGALSTGVATRMLQRKCENQMPLVGLSGRVPSCGLSTDEK